MLYKSFQFGWEQVLIQWKLIGFEAILYIKNHFLCKKSLPLVVQKSNNLKCRKSNTYQTCTLVYHESPKMLGIIIILEIQWKNENWCFSPTHSTVRYIYGFLCIEREIFLLDKFYFLIRLNLGLELITTGIKNRFSSAMIKIVKGRGGRLWYYTNF